MNQQHALPADIQRLPSRAVDAHKGDFGVVLGIGGSVGMAGAISLTGMAAMRTGAGRVKLAVPEAILPTVAGFHPCYMTVPLEHLDEALESSTVVAIGPGIGRGAETIALVQKLFRDCPLPMVVDADALFAIAALPQKDRVHAGPRILTPHAGEFARLLGIESFEPQAREAFASQFAAAHNCTLVLKGQPTIVTDGTHMHLNRTGNPGMASGGMGDVLTGIIAALVAQYLLPFDAAAQATYVHGTAGDLAANEIGPVGIVASDLLERIPRALVSI